MGVPYDIGFELNIYTRNIDDGTHIVEQILPYFNPDYTISIRPIAELDFTKDTPIVLNSVTNSIEHEGNFDAVRFVTWKLTFNMKAYFYGPVSKSKIIRTVNSNIFNDPSLQAGYIIRMNTGEGSGTFKLEDIVYQGDNYQTATAYGIVSSWNADSQKIQITGAQGQFVANSIIRGSSTNAAYTVVSFDASPLKLVNINIVPNPIDAEPGDDYGYTTTITEWPDIE
jgi:hypothetical protein